MKCSILSLEDDPNLSLVMRHYFEDEGINLIQVSNGAEFTCALQKNNFDLILMDLGLPDVDGLSLIPQTRQSFEGPIIVISGKTTTTDRVVGLEMGADDYVTKPFEMRELLARIKANLRRNHIQSKILNQSSDDKSNIFEFNEFIYDSSRLQLKSGEKAIELTSGECALLMIFLQSNGRALSRDYLFEATRGGNFDAYDRAIDISVTRLRKKLNDTATSPKIIKTVRGVGYIFIAEIIYQAA